MKVGDLVILASWCKKGPAVMRIMGENDTLDLCFAMFFEGPDFGEVISVGNSNIFPIEKYEECMKIRKESNSFSEYQRRIEELRVLK